MKKRKLLIFAMIIMSALLLVGCVPSKAVPFAYDLDGKLPKDYLENNSVMPAAHAFTGYETTVEMQAYEGVQSSAIRSYVRVYNVVGGNTRVGVYSFKDEQEILPTIYNAVHLNQYVYYGEQKISYLVYAYVYDIDGKVGLYSIHEDEFLISSGTYTAINFSTSRLDNKTIETLTLTNSEGETIVKRNQVEMDDNDKIVKREEYIGEQKGDFINEPNKMIYTNNPKLKGYSYIYEDGKVTGFKGSKKVFEAVLPTDISRKTFIVGKYLYVQTVVEVAFDADKYSFYNFGDKYQLNMSRIDLTNGKVKTYKNFDYVFGSLAIKKDRKQENTIIRVYATKIENKVLMDENVFLFDSDLKPLVNLTQRNYSDLFYKMDKNLYLSLNKIIVDENHNLVRSLEIYDNIVYLPQEKLISLSRAGRYGLIKPSGEIVVPFEFSQPFKFFNGRAYNIKLSDNKKYFVDPDGFTREIIDANDLLYREGVIVNSVDNVHSYKNYLGTLLFKVEENESLSTFMDIYSDDGEKIGSVVVIYNNDTDKSRLLYLK